MNYPTFFRQYECYCRLHKVLNTNLYKVIMDSTSTVYNLQKIIKIYSYFFCSICGSDNDLNIPKVY